MKKKPRNIRLSEAAALLGCSRNTMHSIAEENGMRKFRLRDRKTSPWYLELNEVERYRQERLTQ